MSFIAPALPVATWTGPSPVGYPANWGEIAETIKAQAGWRCIRCGHPHDVTTGHVLTVHHLDGVKENCAWWNLPPLCQRCHLKIQVKVNLAQLYMFEHAGWFQPYLDGRRAAMEQAARPVEKKQ